MKNILLVFMILVCALLFSCATNSSSASGADEETLPGISAGAANTDFTAKALNDDPVIGKWAAKYEFAKVAQFNGISLIPDNAAFGDLPADVKARKDKAEALCAENRFYDAWLAYGEDDNEYIVALKIMHLVDCWSDTVMHQMFVLSNLSPDQNLYEYRETSGQKGEMIFYDPVEMAEAYAEKNCGGVMPPILNLALGCYYQDAAFYFKDEWIMPLEDAYEEACAYFTDAITAGVYNDYALMMSVDAFLSAGYFTDGIEVIHCLELSDPEYAFLFYNEACSYMSLGEYEKARVCAARAMVCAGNAEDVGANTQVMADSFMYDSRDTKSALAVIQSAKPYMGDDTYYSGPVFMTLNILMFAKNRYPGADYDGQIIQTLNDAFAWEHKDNNYLYELVDYFYNYGFIDLGITWIEGILKEYDGEPVAYGYLNFELGQFYMQLDDYENALFCFNKAEENLKKAGVFDASTSNIPYYQDFCNQNLKGGMSLKGI